jgi:hypothetical protein
LAIGLVLVAASETRIMAEPLIAVETAHAARMSAIAGKPVGVIATVRLEAFLSVTMPLAFSDKNESARSIRWQQVGEVAGTESARAGSVASANENNAIKAKTKRFIMSPPGRCDNHNS